MRTLSALLVALSLTLSLSSPAFASQCPRIMKQVDDKLSSAQLSAGQMEKVRQLREEGERLHKAGKHDESVQKLKEAMAILGG